MYIFLLFSLFLKTWTNIGKGVYIRKKINKINENVKYIIYN